MGFGFGFKSKSNKCNGTTETAAIAESVGEVGKSNKVALLIWMNVLEL